MEKKIDINMVSTLALAYLGDAVLEVKIRNYAIMSNKVKLNALHRSSVRYVNAKAQSLVYDQIQGDLLEDELVILKKGRNSKKSIPKNVMAVDYRKSTGLEALLGYLYLLEKNDRIEEIVDMVIAIVEGRKSDENTKSSDLST